MDNTKYARWSFLVITGFLFFRIFYIATTHYNLIADEAYFWEWSRNPDWSYYDMGPMVAWVIWFFTSIFGHSEFAVRVGAPILYAMTASVIYLLASEILKSRKLAFITIVLFHITPISTAGGVIMTYYSPQIFFMALTAFFLWRLVKQGDGWWWYLIGLSLGMGFLSHHMFSVFSAEVGLFILLSGKQRKWLGRKEPYIALAIEIAVASPVFIWNMTHQAVMAKHAIGLMSVSSKALRVFGDYIAGQAGIQTPFFFLAVIYGIIISGYRGLVKKDDTHLYLFCLSAPLFVFIGILCLGGRTEANWPISAYITGGIAAIAALNNIYENASNIRKRLVRGALYFTVFIGAAVWMIASYPQTIHAVTGLHIPPDKDPSNRLYGWDQLGEEITAQMTSMPPGSFIAARDYGMAALLAFYTDGKPRVFEIPDGRRMSQYDFWNDKIPVHNKNAVFADKRKMRPKTRAMFERVELARKMIIKAEGSDLVRKKLYIYRCYGYKADSGTPDTY